MGIATLQMSSALFKQLANLPEGTVVRGSLEGDDQYIWVRVEHPDIPDGSEVVTPSFRRQPEIIFEKWNAK